MKIVKTINEMRKIIKEWKKVGYSIGFVPTMGYLHAGHGALIKKSVKNNNKTVVSVFVNPTQFAPNEDLEKYPRNIQRDIDLVESLNGDVIFNPEAEEIYNKKNYTSVIVKELSEKLCGITRPTHFAGVCQIVLKLFNIITPDNAYFGLKDFQQYVIIKTMVDDLNIPVQMNPVDIVREESGLALSSRNVYLTDKEKQSALSLSIALIKARNLIDNGEYCSSNIVKLINSIINSYPYTKVDYIKIVNSETLEDIDIINNNNFAILLAIYVGNVRLIDNYISSL